MHCLILFVAFIKSVSRFCFGLFSASLFDRGKPRPSDLDKVTSQQVPTPVCGRRLQRSVWWATIVLCPPSWHRGRSAAWEVQHGRLNSLVDFYLLFVQDRWQHSIHSHRWPSLAPPPLQPWELISQLHLRDVSWLGGWWERCKCDITVSLARVCRAVASVARRLTVIIS